MHNGLSQVYRKNPLVYKGLTHKAQKKMHLKMSFAKVVCCIKLPNITDELGIEANSVDPEQIAPISLIWVHTVCNRGYLKISADEKSKQLLLRLAH